MTTPLLIGPGARPLYAALHPPVAVEGARHAALVLNPWGWEALRAHRTLTQLGRALAAEGVACLRFDYSGTGDSAGVLEDATLDTWVDDAEWALDEVLALSGASSASLIGLRMGALVAAALASRRTREIDRVVLWGTPSAGVDVVRWVEESPALERAAFPMPDSFAREISGLGFDGLSTLRGRVAVVGSEGDVPGGLVDTVDTCLTPAQGTPCWVEDQDHGAGQVPVPVIRAVTDWLTR